MALAAIAAIAALVALTGSSGDTTPGPGDSAPDSVVAAEERRQNAARADGATPAPSAETAVRTEGPDGRTYSCSFDVLDRVDSAKDRVTRREKVLKARRAAVRRIEAQYPNGEAPPDVVDRYNELFARANAQVTWTNKAIRRYNQVLRDACDPG
jgi:hypothetical protein